MDSKKTVIFVYALHHFETIASKYGVGDCIIVAMSPQSQTLLHKYGLKFKTPDNYVSKNEYKDIDDNAWKFSDIIGNASLGDKTLDETLVYKNLYLWNIIHFELYYYFLKDIITNLQIVFKILDREKPDNVLVFDNNERSGDAVISVCNAKHISAELIAIRSLERFKDKVKILTAMNSHRIHSMPKLLGMVFRIREIERRFHARLFEKHIQIDKRDKSINRILMFAHAQNHIYALEPVYNELKTNPDNEILTIRLDSIVDDSTKKELEKAGMPYRTFEGYYTKRIVHDTKKFEHKLSVLWNTLRNDADFKDSLKYRDVAVWGLIEEAFQYFFSTRKRFVEIVKYIETLNEIFAVEQPDLIIATNLIVPFGRTVVDTANQLDIPSLYIQHGITSEHLAHSVMCATKMAASGQFNKNVIVNHGIDPNKIIITGQPKYDFFAEKNFETSYSNICRKLDLDPAKKIIAYTSQPLKKEENNTLLSCILDSLSEFPDLQLVIKLHPDEIGISKDVSKSYDMNKIRITKDIDLYELLSACEIMMTAFSTTALEAMMLDKPVITINLTGEPDKMPYAESGAAIGVYKKEDLSPAIKNIFKDEQVKRDLALNRKRFVHEHAYKVDGQASYRVVKLIEKMISEGGNSESR